MARTALVVGGDLMAKARLSDAAARARVELITVPVGGMSEALRTHRPDLVILDLDGGREAVLGELETARRDELVPTDVVGYLSHVDVDLEQAASKAGCRPIARGRFWASLGELFANQPEAPD
jgi:hypothetical protein